MNDLPNCPLCGGDKLAVVASRPNANSCRVECACGVAGEWGKGEDGARAGWVKLAARFAPDMVEVRMVQDAAPVFVPASPPPPAALGKRGKGAPL